MFLCISPGVHWGISGWQYYFFALSFSTLYFVHRYFTSGSPGGFYRMFQEKMALRRYYNVLYQCVIVLFFKLCVAMKIISIYDLRVPPNSIIKGIKQFAITGLEYLNHAGRKPTSREASVEKLLSFLENPYDDNSDKWDQVSVKYIGHYFSARQIQQIRDLIKSNPEFNGSTIAKKICLMFGINQTGK